MERRVEILERRLGNIIAIEQKLDRVLQENDTFRKEVYNLTKENCELLREKMDLENKYSVQTPRTVRGFTVHGFTYTR